MRKILHIIALLFLALAPLQGREREPWLDELDAELAKKDEYDARKEARIGQLRGRLRSALDDRERYGVTQELYEEYQSYKYDSAYAYAQEMARLAAVADLPDARVEAGCATTFCLISAGLYKEAFDVMGGLQTDGVSPRTLLEYYKMQVRLNYSARGYSQTPPYWDIYSRAGEEYSRRILEMVPEGSPTWWEYQANYLMESAQYEEGIAAFNRLLADENLDLHSRAIFASSVGWLQHCLGRDDEAIKSLCESAVFDLKSSTKETTALRMLAEYLTRRGEVERPSRYVRESFDDANFYNARLRKLEVGAVLPLVEKNHYDSLQRERNLLAWGLALLALVILAAVAALLFIRRQNRRLHEARATIEERNAQL